MHRTSSRFRARQFQHKIKGDHRNGRTPSSYPLACSPDSSGYHRRSKRLRRQSGANASTHGHANGYSGPRANRHPHTRANGYPDHDSCGHPDARTHGHPHTHANGYSGPRANRHPHTSANATRTTTPVDTPAPVPTDTPIPASPTPEPPATVTQLDVNVDTGTVWQEVFDALTASEQSCIRNALGEESLESALDQPVLKSDTAEWEVSIFVCLAPETADALFLSSLIAEMEELSEAEESCLRELVADSDLAALVAAPEDSAAAAEFITGMVNCVPDLILAVMIAELGVGVEELSEDGASCLREWVTGADVVALLAAPDDPAVVGAFAAGLVICAPELFLSVVIAEVGVELEELSEDEASCLRELVADSDLAALIAAPEDSAMYVQFAAGLIICIPDLLLSSDPDPRLADCNGYSDPPLQQTRPRRPPRQRTTPTPGANGYSDRHSNRHAHADPCSGNVGCRSVFSGFPFDTLH